MSSSFKDEPSKVQAFREWFTANGGYLHPSAAFIEEPSGMSVKSTKEVPKDTKVVSCPFSLAITPQDCKNALSEIIDKTLLELDWSEYQLIATYIVLHWILEEDTEGVGLQSPAGKLFRHLPYIHILPSIYALRTPRYFTPSEKAVIQNTDVGKSAVKREEQQQRLFRTSHKVISRFRPEWKERFSWDRFSAACTYISSRAFPSTVLSPTPSLKPSPDSYPVLLPGVDSLNHARGQPVTWLVDSMSPKKEDISSSGPSPSYEISLVIHAPTPAGSEFLNNYGPKSNAELLLGYGFTIPNNPEDVIAFEMRDPQTGSSLRIEVGRNESSIEPLWERMKGFTKMSLGDGDEEIEDWELDIEAGGTFLHFLSAAKAKIPRLPKEAGALEDVRPDVFEMIRYYIQGITEITENMIAFAMGKKEEGRERAVSLGIHYAEESDDELGI
ncbi:hypothetical protein M422DRAFT_23363 [Sphaerobolus stellatus SS14]|nr:hypothetical protein M422DRAFT_23363 [Sphaerobolus stellatus SS14]